MTFLTALGLAKPAGPKKQSFEDFDSSPMYETTVDKGPHVDGIDNHKQSIALRRNPVAPPTSSLDYRYGD